MSQLPDASVFYLLGGISFFILALILYIISPQRDAGTLLPLAGIAVAGALSLVAYFGTRRKGDSHPPQ
jgi:hypothetical protein